MLAKIANDNAGGLAKPIKFKFFASKLAPATQSSQAFMNIAGCIAHRTALYCRAFLASRLHQWRALERWPQPTDAALKPPLLNVPL
ncbi:hypothetical protein AO260_10015 [Pseudomonas sp. ABAC21]|nr:hypothetical protein AO260_10015 [Pseudomonas sp. ABAC21]